MNKYKAFVPYLEVITLSRILRTLYCEYDDFFV